MNPILQEYINRFVNNNASTKQTQFYTQLSKETFSHNLPYIVDIEYFCIRVKSAINNNEKICIYSDYDTDAVTATAVMYFGLLMLGVSEKNLSFYAPDRFTEGYGINAEAISKLADTNDLIISVDCGINSVEEANIVKRSKCDLIITDHHHLTGNVPDAICVVNPRLNSFFLQKKEQIDLRRKRKNKDLNLNDTEKYLLQKELNNVSLLSEAVTGVGVAWFCLVWLAYYLQYFQFSIEIMRLNKLLGFVAIGTIADCQSILDPTNRLLVKSGIQILSNNQHTFFGLNELMSQTGLLGKISQGYQLTSQDLGFTLAPILNASGRIAHANLSISAMTAHNKDEAALLVQELISINEKRKQLVKSITKEVETSAQEQFENGNKVLWFEGSWNKGIIGLLASRVVNDYGLPVIVISEDESTKLTASLRAPKGYHIPEAFENHAHLYIKSGGHPGAAGFSAYQENKNNIKHALIQALTSQQVDAQAILSSHVPERILLKIPSTHRHLAYKENIIFIEDSYQINAIFIGEIFTLDPYGQEFPFPHLMFEISNWKYTYIGEGYKHIRLTYQSFSIPFFNIDEEARNKLNQSNIDIGNLKLLVIAKPSQNTFNGSTRMELIGDKLFFL